jgi:tRNA dimethylallyltransferase
MKNKLPKIIVVAGPTASGKTDLAILMAKKFGGEVICADSRTVYRYMNIGTAKPIRKGQKPKKDRDGYSYYTVKGIRHYALDIVSPDQNYSVADFKELAVKIAGSMIKRNKIPMLVGGTGLYIKAVVDNLDFPENASSPKIRKQLEKEIQKYGLEKLYKKLLKLDPAAEKFIDPKNPRRIIRALEVMLTTGQKFSDQRKKGKKMFDALQIGIKVNKEVLKERIGRRIEKMARAGFVDEVKSLKKKYGCSTPAMSGIGYKQFCLYLDKKISFEQAKENFKLGDRHYSKRQMTWFKKDKRIKWIENNPSIAAVVVKKFLRS